MPNQPNVSAFKLALIAGAGMFLSSLDSSVVGMANSTFLRYFHSNMTTVNWILTLYTLVLGVSILPVGLLADRLGYIRVYQFGLLLSALGALLSGLASHIAWLIIFRGVQGFAAAIVQATAMTIITTQPDQEQIPKTMGFCGMVIGLGPLLAPFVASVILHHFSWPWLFWVSIPICLVTIMGCRTLPAVERHLSRQAFSYVNLSCLALSLFLLLLAIQALKQTLSSAVVLLLSSVLFLVGYVYRERFAAQPIIPIALFKSLRFGAMMSTVFALGGMIAVLVIVPPLFLELKQVPVWRLSFIMALWPLGVVTGSRLSIRWVQRVGVLPVVLVAVGMLTLSSGILTQLQLNWPLSSFALLLLLMGLGGGLLQTPSYQYIARQFAHNQQGFIFALIRMMQNIGIAFVAAGIALLIDLKLTQSAELLLHGIQHAWCLAMIVCFLPLFLLLKLWYKTRMSNKTC